MIATPTEIAGASTLANAATQHTAPIPTIRRSRGPGLAGIRSALDMAQSYEAIAGREGGTSL
ncbi:hypothetical protein GCM10022202_02180 [Microbacterium marinilacus]|uniref:Uncharacterized protein n=1 Tax=Microbacterium marinilacus TaxID=415209 RepID=A0ABP7B378_9MICO